MVGPGGSSHAMAGGPSTTPRQGPTKEGAAELGGSCPGRAQGTPPPAFGGAVVALRA